MPVAVITGGTKGIGLAIAETFLNQGFDVAVCSRTAADLEKQRTDWQHRFPEAQILTRQVDVASKAQLTDFALEVSNRFEQIDVLVNNAGVFLPGPLLDERDGHFEKMMETNLYSVYHLCRLLVPAMVKQGFGHIFNLSSIAGLQAYPNGGSYSISKFAVRGLTENLRYELREKGVKVTAITPGAVFTDSWKDSGVAPTRIMSAEDVAAMVWAIYQLGSAAVVEDIILRPQLGDL